MGPKSSAKRMHDRGAWLGGFTMTVLPAARGAATFAPANMTGWMLPVAHV